MVITSIRQVELGEDMLYVLLNGSLGDPQLMGNSGIGTPLGHESEHLTLAGAEDRQRVIPALDGEKLVLGGR